MKRPADTHDIRRYVRVGRREERAYWRFRPEFLKKYKGLWVAISGGKVIASAGSKAELADKVYDAGVSKPFFVTIVGDEERAVARVRRAAAFSYDAKYDPPLPRAAVSFGDRRGKRVARFDDVIPDTGSDITALPLRSVTKGGVIPECRLPRDA